MSENINIKKDLFKDLYDNGIVKVEGLLDQQILNEIVNAKNKIFTNFPYGQNDKYEKIENPVTNTGDYPINLKNY